MAYEKKPNTGTLWKNDKRESDRHPEYKGDALIEGQEMWVDAWVNEVKQGEHAGRKYFRLSFKAKEQRPVAHNDDLPF